MTAVVIAEDRQYVPHTAFFKPCGILSPLLVLAREQDRSVYRNRRGDKRRVWRVVRDDSRVGGEPLGFIPFLQE